MSMRTNVYESADHVALQAELPGVKEADLEVLLEGDLLTVRAKSAVTEPQGATLAWREFETPTYERVFELGFEVEREAITAVLKDGVLRIVLPKARAKTRKIEVLTPSAAVSL